MAVWVVRAGVQAEAVEAVRKTSVIAIGWEEMGDCSGLAEREEFKARYREAYPEDTSAVRIAGQAGQVYRFACEIASGDIIMTPDSPAREVLIGKVTGGYRYDPSLVAGYYAHVRSVEWLKTVSRDDLSPTLRNVVGGALTLFAVEGYDSEVQRLLEGAPPVEEEAAHEDQPSLYEDTVAKADELIADTLASIGPYEFQNLVAAVLRAMGMRTRVSPPGPDKGTDIVAHPDALGFEQPRIRVQVKHTKGAIGAPDLRSFRAVIRPDEKGLFICTGGFTRDALQEPSHVGPHLTLMDREQFVDLLIEHYEGLEPEFQAMVPMKKVYIPVAVG
jgi:restriction system protein